MLEGTAKIIEKIVKSGTSGVNDLEKEYQKETGFKMGTTFQEVTKIEKDVSSPKEN